MEENKVELENAAIEFLKSLDQAENNLFLTTRHICMYATRARILDARCRAALRMFIHKNLWKLKDAELREMLSEGQILLSARQRQMLDEGTDGWVFYHIDEHFSPNQLAIIAEEHGNSKRFQELLDENPIIFSNLVVRAELLKYMQSSNIIRDKRRRRDISPSRKNRPSTTTVPPLHPGPIPDHSSSGDSDSSSSDSSYDAE